MNRLSAVVLAVLVVASFPATAVAGGASASDESNANLARGQANADAYTGTHVEFETAADSVVDYRVDGEQVFENVTVASRNDAEDGTSGSAGADLSAAVDLEGIGIDLDVRSETRAEIATESSASLTAHDTDRGILTVDAGEESQSVVLNLSGESNAEAAQESDARVLVETDDRTGALIVVGDGNVTVAEQGTVTADLESDSTLVFRSYADGERTDEAEAQERLIAEGVATAEVYADERDGERVADVATYGQDIAVDTATDASDRIELTAERAHGEGTVVITSLSEAALAAGESAADLSVTVDGEAAAKASSYSELEGGIGEEPRYMVTQSSDASAAADVLIAVDHFSERELTIRSADEDGSGSDGDDEAGDDSLPGFGVVTGLVAVLVGVAARVRS
ncbi:hypothetical protein [Natrialba asiatica]|uniref:PGF-CTERM sorting domain-containing protein n=1 Tax=Natrialba asiatica (strain ATCC 700177 / DSM 12278 / JCM 9576 / FERM P-10747 / NBRC 102637 / 172P1) TaxID=29540 RepID=M0B2J7_NATA1|nr:hypothetical protein [Natrialba asiatica]ELZ03904.1 hypothetical protein C481_04978 [Natrialba asiatica DSM 12278]